MPDMGSVVDQSFEQEADRLTRTVIRPGNSVSLLPRGVDSYDHRWRLIENAERTLHMVSFSFMRDDTTKRLAQLVTDKAHQGVEVKMIVDDAALYTTRSRGVLDEMAKAGAEILTYNKLTRDLWPNWREGRRVRKLVRNVKVFVKRRFHEKYMVVDGREAVLGGMNWGTKYALGGSDPKYWRDTDSHLTGPVVADIQRRFLGDVFVYRAMDAEAAARKKGSFDRTAYYADVHKQADDLMAAEAERYFPPLAATGDTRIRYVGHKPWDEEFFPLTNASLQLIRGAQKSILWGCHGVRPPRVVAENLADAAARGVEIHLISNSKKSSRGLMARGLLGWMYWECSNHFRWLIERGIHVHEWQQQGPFHSKCLVVDDQLAAVGSYNIANGSTFHHTESAVFVQDPGFAAVARKQFETDLSGCQELSLDRAKKPLRWFDPFRRPLHERNLTIDESLWPERVRADLEAKRFEWKYSDPHPGMTPS